MTAECPPRWAPPRRGRSPHVRAVEATARELGTPLMPWQRLVAGVALEEVRGLPRWREVQIAVPRQSGKTSLLLALLVWWLLREPDQRIVYGAQSRQAARAKLLNDWWPTVAGSELAERFTLYRAYGAEKLTADNGSSLELVSNREAAGHGSSLDLVLLDECWSQVDARAEQALRPAMVTKRRAQMWMVSTAGTSKSFWWRQRVEAGRQAMAAGTERGAAHFEWSAPEDADPADEKVWRATMPALGRTVHIDVIRQDYASMPVGEFQRAYLNQWDTEADGWTVFDKDAWAGAWEGSGS